MPTLFAMFVDLTPLPLELPHRTRRECRCRLQKKRVTCPPPPPSKASTRYCEKYLEPSLHAPAPPAVRFVCRAQPGWAHREFESAYECYPRLCPYSGINNRHVSKSSCALRRETRSPRPLSNQTAIEYPHRADQSHSAMCHSLQSNYPLGAE